MSQIYPIKIFSSISFQILHSTKFELMQDRCFWFNAQTNFVDKHFIAQLYFCKHVFYCPGFGKKCSSKMKVKQPTANPQTGEIERR